MYFGGLFIIYDKIPVGWQWYSWTTFLRYGWTALMVNQFEGLDANESFGDMNILEFYCMDGQHAWANTGYLAIICAFFGCLGCLCVKYIDHSQR